MFNKEKNELDKLKKKIEGSGFFDKLYYLKTYHDVRISDMTPIEHYAEIGIKEDRKPNESFDPIWYRNYYEDVKKDGGYPLLHYILFGKEEDRFQNESEMIKIENKENTLILKTVEEDNSDYFLLRESEYFDSNYYLDTYSDVKDAGIDAIKHYLVDGYKENRNPSKIFDTKYYMDIYEDVKNSEMNPLVHYLRFGYKEDRKTYNQNDLKKLSSQKLKSLFKKDFEIPKFNIDKPIDIIIPVYNGYEYLGPLFESIVNNTNLPYRLLVCDDKSPDEKVLPFLKKFSKDNPKINIELLENEKNLGFIKTVNRLSKYIKNHFVLLNTDTEVPKDWIERLMYPIFEMENIASTTPFTNAGTICSFPNYLEDNKLILEGLNVNEVDEYFKYVNFENTYIDIPTGVGFCMGVNKNLVDKIGMFDEIFGKGYGEENDWCQRAIKEGFQNIHVPDLFVYHKHGGSFPSEEKKRLIESNLKTLNKKHNTFDKQVQKTIQENKLDTLRNIVYFKIMSNTKYSSLVFDHALGGGANHYLDELVKTKLEKNEVVCLIRYDYNSTKDYIVKFISSTKEYVFKSSSIFNLLDILKIFKFDEIFLNSFVSYPNIEDFIVLINKLKNKQNKLIVPIHDFFPVCPSYTLLDNTTKHCGVPSDFQKCNNCLKLHQGEFKAFEKEKSIKNWRDMWNDVFSISDDILCFSNSSKEIFQKAYTKYNNKIIVIPHNIKGRYEKIYDPENINTDKNIIGVLGGINEAKGANIVNDLVNHIKDNNLNAKVVLIGQISIPIEESEYFHCTGRYKIKELPDIVKTQKITQFLIPSIWPETFSYTTDEIMQLGYPLTVFDLGAPAERVKNYELGRVIKYDQLNKIVS